MIKMFVFQRVKVLLEKTNTIKSDNIILIGDFNARTKVLNDTLYEGNQTIINDSLNSTSKIKK